MIVVIITIIMNIMVIMIITLSLKVWPKILFFSLS